MNDLQRVQLGILNEFDRLCRLFNIPYSLAAGTALGAVRHKGFIPWDDDIDVYIMRNDFKRLKKAWEQEAPPHLFLQTYETDPEHHMFCHKIRDCRTTQIEEDASHIKNMNHGIYIDVFLLDYTPASLWLRQIQKFLFALFIISTRSRALAKNKVGKTCRFIFRLLPVKLRILYQKALEGLIMLIGTINTRGVTKFWIVKKGFFRKPPRTASEGNFSQIYDTSPPDTEAWLSQADLLADLVDVPFENESVRLMRDWDTYLSYRFGDYMTPPPPELRVPPHTATVIDTETPYTEYICKRS
ncbi:MAG: LicD family protein [Defluviitaleaceae bacterium]|nr:LicD family protein [Defluviitaleaceae bacterium]